MNYEEALDTIAKFRASILSTVGGIWKLLSTDKKKLCRSLDAAHSSLSREYKMSIEDHMLVKIPMADVKIYLEQMGYLTASAEVMQKYADVFYKEQNSREHCHSCDDGSQFRAMSIFSMDISPTYCPACGRSVH